MNLDKIRQDILNGQGRQVNQRGQEHNPSWGQIGTGLGTEVVIGEGGRLGGAAIGTAILPGVGTAIGYTAGALGGGALGSIAAQRIEGREDISWGRVIADSFINLVPGSKAVKGGRTGARLLSAATTKGTTGALIGGVSSVVEAGVDEGRFPTAQEMASRTLGGGLLGAGFGVSGETMGKLYKKFGGMKNSTFDAAMRANDQDAHVFTGTILEEAWVRTREELQDSLVRAKNFMKANPAKGDMDNFYAKHRLSGELEAQLRSDFDVQADLVLKTQKLYAQRHGLKLETVEQIVDDLAVAKHAPYFNNKLDPTGKKFPEGAAQMTGVEAQKIKAQVDQLPEPEILHGLSKKMADMSSDTMDIMVDAGRITKAGRRKAKAAYPNHISLFRDITEDPEEFAKQYTANGGLGNPLKKALGSEKTRLPVLQNQKVARYQAARLLQQNNVHRSIAEYIKLHPDAGLANVRSMQYPTMTRSGTPLPETLAANELRFFDKAGKSKVLAFADTKIAESLKMAPKATRGIFLKAGLLWNRGLGQLYTGYHVGFPAPNKVRDVQESFVNTAAKLGFKDTASMLNPVRILKEMDTIRNHVFGNGKGQGSAEFKEFLASGGSSGGLARTAFEEVEQALADITKKGKPGIHTQWKKFEQVVGKVNAIFEDSTRFSVFKQARKRGKSRQEAALMARDSSFDPRLQGKAGDTLRAMYLFSNPAIQGMTNIIRSMRDPKVAAAVMGGLTVTAGAIDAWNSSIDPSWRENLQAQSGSNWLTNRNFVLLKGRDSKTGNLDYVSMPKAYPMIPFAMAADAVQRIARGDVTGEPKDFAKELADETISAYNPMGGSLIPSAFRPISDLQRNKDGLGREIRPEWLEQKNISETEKVYPWTPQTNGGKLAMELANQLEKSGFEVSPENLKYLYSTYAGGPGSLFTRVLGVGSKIWNGQEIHKREIPILRRFWGQSQGDAALRQGGLMRTVEAEEKKRLTQDAKDRRIAYDIVERWSAEKDPNKKALIIANARKDGLFTPEIQAKAEAKVKRDKAGLGNYDTGIKRAPIKNMHRAKLYIKLIDQMEPDVAEDFIEDQINKKLLTARVRRQIQIIRNRN